MVIDEDPYVNYFLENNYEYENEYIININSTILAINEIIKYNNELIQDNKKYLEIYNKDLEKYNKFLINGNLDSISSKKFVLNRLQEAWTVLKTPKEILKGFKWLVQRVIFSLFMKAIIGMFTLGYTDGLEGISQMIGATWSNVSSTLV